MPHGSIRSIAANSCAASSLPEIRQLMEDPQ